METTKNFDVIGINDLHWPKGASASAFSIPPGFVRFHQTPTRFPAQGVCEVRPEPLDAQHRVEDVWPRRPERPERPRRPRRPESGRVPIQTSPPVSVHRNWTDTKKRGKEVKDAEKFGNARKKMWDARQRLIERLKKSFGWTNFYSATLCTPIFAALLMDIKVMQSFELFFSRNKIKSIFWEGEEENLTEGGKT